MARESAPVGKWVRHWKSSHDNTDGWHAALRIGRVEVGFHLWRHSYPLSPERWVAQPWGHYDRSRRSLPLRECVLCGRRYRASDQRRCVCGAYANDRVAVRQ